MRRGGAFLLQGGSLADDKLHAVAATGDGSVILAGSTACVRDEPSIASGDFVAMKLDVDGNLVWTWQVSCGSPVYRVKTKLETGDSVSID